MNRASSDDTGPARSGRKVVRSFTASQEELHMLEALARYHGLSRTAVITSLVRKEFWRIFPQGTPEVPPEPGARVIDKETSS